MAKGNKGNSNNPCAADPRASNIDLERLVELDLMRATEAAALNSYRWLGKGDAQAAHAAAVDAMRGALDLTSVSGTVLFGDGLKHQSGGIEPGEKLGNWCEGSLEMDLAMVPIDGISLVAGGYWGAISVLVAACREGNQPALVKVPCRYMSKIAYGPAVKAGPGQLDMDASVRDNLEIIAMHLGKRVQDLNVAVLERDRHGDLIEDIRRADASVKLIKEGDIPACLAPSWPNTDTDAYMGTGGATEAIVVAAAVKCLGGDMLAKPAPIDEQEERQIIESLGEKALQKQFHAGDLAPGKSVIFCASGISDGSILRGVHVDGSRTTTSSVVMRTRFNTIRKVEAIHDLSQKTIRLRNVDAEAKL